MHTIIPCTFVATVKNESASIDAFMNSLLRQTHMPAEVCIVDALSTDGTWDKLQGYVSVFAQAGSTLVLVQQAGNRSVGRNSALSRATHTHVCVSDAGCVLDDMWCERLMSGFDAPGVRCGWYEPVCTTSFQKAMACYTCVRRDVVQPETFLPSSRSVAFDVASWKAVGGYPEELDTCEDLVFAQRLIAYAHSRSYEVRCVFDAVVHWPQVGDVRRAWKQLHGYAIGDGQAGFVRWQVPLIFARYAVGLGMVQVAYLMRASYPNAALMVLGVLGVGLVAYSVWAVSKNARYVHTRTEKAYLILLQYLSDLAVMTGFVRGSLHRHRLIRTQNQNVSL